MAVQKAVNSNSLVESSDSSDIKKTKQNPFYEVNAVKRRDVSIEYIAVLPSGHEEGFQSQAELINWLTNDCGDAKEALEAAYSDAREGAFDEDDLYLFCRENAIEVAEECGYVIHDVLKWRMK